MTIKHLAVGDGINWMWFCLYSIENDQAIIHAEDRHHKGDDICGDYCDACGHPRRHYSFVEPRVADGQPRMITHLIIDNGNVRTTYRLRDGPLPRFGHGHLRMTPEQALAS
jgi:hypothetical protein